MTDEDVDCIAEVKLDAFQGGTRIESWSDGSLRLRLPLMPPSWATREDGFDSFQQRLQEVIGTKVDGLDKELFLVRAPHANTVERISAFLLELRDAARRRSPG